MVIKKLNLEYVCGVTSKLPEPTLVEYAFAGKSNVGKSSLINTLIQRKAYARTSSSPGKTQTLNFYNVNDTLYLVDLPGYGYAKVSAAERERWGVMIEKYLRERSKKNILRYVFLLVDIRHEPSANDRQMFDWVIYHGYRPVVVATKLDKINRSQVQKHCKMIRTGLGMQKDDVLIPFSSETKQGREELWALLEEPIVVIPKEHTEDPAKGNVSKVDE